MSSAGWKGTVWVKLQLHCLKPQCFMGICMFVKYILWSTYSAPNAACYGIADEGRLILCPEGQVASNACSFSLQLHCRSTGEGFFQVSAAGWFSCPDETLPSSVPIPGGDQARRPPGTFQLLLWSPGSPPSKDLTWVCEAQT